MGGLDSLQISDLRGGSLARKREWCFWEGGWYPNTHYENPHSIVISITYKSPFCILLEDWLTVNIWKHVYWSLIVLNSTGLYWSLTVSKGKTMALSWNLLLSIWRNFLMIARNNPFSNKVNKLCLIEKQVFTNVAAKTVPTQVSSS